MASLGALCAIGPVSIDMYLPAAPVMGAALGAAQSQVSVSLASYLVGVLLGQLSHGLMSDRFGRKPPLCGGLFLYTVASFACAWVAHVEWLIALRFIQGVGGSAGMVIVRAMVHDRADSREMARSFSLLMLVASVAPLLAPLAGATVLHAAGWRAIFGAMGIFGTVLFALSIAIPETHDRSRREHFCSKKTVRDWQNIVCDRQFLLCTLSNGFVQGGMYAYLALSSMVFIGVYGKSAMSFSVIFAIGSLGMVVGAQINARLVRRISLRRIAKNALWVSVASSVAIAAFPKTPPFAVLLVGTFIYLSSIGMIAPNLAAMALARHSSRAGSASALLGTVLYGVGALTGVMAAHVFTDAPTRALAVVMASCAVLAVLFLWGAQDELS